jgi:hydroxyacylglutathione hydrolase
MKRYYKITALPLFSDNYSYIVQNTGSKDLVLIDPAQPNTVTSYLKEFHSNQLVSHILYTHKHWDHAGGSEELINSLNNQNIQVLIGQHDQ